MKANSGQECCNYCGLPVSTLWRQSSREPSGQPANVASPVYCCYGCQLAESIVDASGEEGRSKGIFFRLGLAVFFSMNVMVFSLALWSQDVAAAGTDDALATALWNLFRYLCLLFALPVFFLLGLPMAASAIGEIRQGRWGMDLLVVTGVGASFVFSMQSVLSDGGPIYFDVGCMVLVMVTLGRWLEATGKLKATEAVESMGTLLPEEARVVGPDGEKTMPTAEVRVGMKVRILPGERAPCDAKVLSGACSVDEQIVTGESSPALKRPGGQIFGGTLDVDGEVVARVTAAADQGTVAQMAALVDDAARHKGRYQRLADRVSAIFLPFVVLLALGTLVFHSRSVGVATGVQTALAVLLVACPCALGLATPMAIWAALGRAARKQVLFRTGLALEKLAGVRAIRFDKTGTITSGTARVESLFCADGEQVSEILSLAAGMSAGSLHPLSAAISQYCASRVKETTADSSLDDVRTSPGLGLTYRDWNGRTIHLGSQRLMQNEGCGWDTEDLEQQYREVVGRESSVVCLAVDRRIKAFFETHEDIRPEAKATIQRLGKHGFDVAVLTGDNAGRAAKAQGDLGVAVCAEMLPEDKQQAILQTRESVGPVAMVGDGINDAPALAAADVGVAMGCGADLVRNSADVCLLTDDLRRLAWAIDLSQQTIRVIRQNLFWAFSYNLVAVGFAATGVLNPALAAAAMTLSSLLVVGNTLKLRAGTAPAQPKQTDGAVPRLTASTEAAAC